MNINFRNIFLSALLATAGISYGQVRISVNNQNSSAANSSAFIDASSNTTYNGSTNIGKGLLYPRVDLTTFTAFGGTPTGIPTSYPNRYDGFVVYNTAAVGAAGVGNTEGTLTPGFWYYENKTTNVNGGTWKPLGGSSSGGYEPENGLSLSNDKIQLGGTLIQNTTIAQGNNLLAFTSNVANGFSVDGTTFSVDAANNRVGIGTASPASALEVNGAATNTAAFNAGAGATINFAQSNLAYTTANPGAFTLQNLKNGGTYTLSVRGTVSGTSSFTASGFTVKSVNNGATVAGRETLYTLIVMGTTVYVYMASGF